jgi:hypothetical protein
MPQQTKICENCRKKSASEMLICQRCQSTFKDKNDRSFMSWGLITAMTVTYLLHRWLDDSIDPIYEGLINTFLVIGILAPIHKLFQKRENPYRKIIAEVVYRYAKSFYMVVIGILIIFSALFLFKAFIIDVSTAKPLGTSLDDINLNVFISLIITVLYFGIYAIFMKGKIFPFTPIYDYIIQRHYDQVEFKGWLGQQHNDCYFFYKDGIRIGPVDKATFQLLIVAEPYEYAKDINHVFRSDGYVIPDADTESFEFIRSEDGHYYFARDSYRVYYLDMSSRNRVLNGGEPTPILVVENCNPSTIVDLGHAYVKDDTSIWWGSEKILQEADVETFKVLNRFIAKDKAHIYALNGTSSQLAKEIDRTTFELIEGQHCKDNSGMFKCADGQVTQL